MAELPRYSSEWVNSRQRTLVAICQAYPPDPTAVGQHIADIAEEVRHCGWRVVVFAASRDYENPQHKYPTLTNHGHVQVYRLPFSSFGKRSIAVRLIAQVLFAVQATCRALLCRDVDAVLVSTLPPFLGLCGAIIAVLRRAHLTWWVMDLNPDQMIRLGRIRSSSYAARVFEWMNRVTLHRADEVVVLDRYIERSIIAKGVKPRNIRILPPWAPTNFADTVEHSGDLWRRENLNTTARVVMYSGNHGITSPLDTLLRAIGDLPDDINLFFAFVGGGVCKRLIDDIIASERPANILSLPYQPLERLHESLAAADVHVVSIAEATVGVSHSCKIYGAMAVGKPILALAPENSHVGDIISQATCGWLVEPGDAFGIVQVLREIAAQPSELLTEMGKRGRQYVIDHANRQDGIAEMCRLIVTTPKN